MAKSTVTKAVAYARFSSDHQREESIDAQLRAIHEYAQKNNIIIVGEFIDRAKSATTDNRPEFLKMIDASKEHEFNAVVVHKLDRFSRNRYDAEFYKRTLLRNGVILKSATENFDGSPESIILESVIQGMSEYYSKNLAREVMKGLKENAYSCRHTGGIPPLGYKLDKETKKLVINESEAEIVRLVYKRAIDGIGYASIADELNRRGCKSKIGRNFTSNSISTLLRNPKYVGDYIYNRSSSKDVDGKRNGHAYKDKSEWIVVEGGCPAIISREDFEFIAAKRERDRMSFLGHKRIEEYLLTGKIVCGCCGGSFVGERRWDKRREKSYVKYCCNIKKRQGASICDSKYIDRDALESLVLCTLATEVFCDAMVERITGYYNQYCNSMEKDKKEHMEGLAHKQKELTQNIETLVDMITKTQSEALLGRLTRLEDEKREIDREFADMQRESDLHAVTKDDIWNAFDSAKCLLRKGKLSNLKKLVEVFIKQIIIYRDGILIEFNFARQYVPSPLLQYRHLPISDVIKLKKEDMAKYQNHENFLSKQAEWVRKNQCASNDTHWCGGEGGI